MDPVWYYVRGGTQTGPVSFEELKSAAAAGHFAPDDLVWQEGTPDWVPANTVPGLFAGAAAPPPLPAAVAPDPLPVGEALRKKQLEPAPMRDRPAAVPQSRAGEIAALAMEFLRRTTETNPVNIAPNPAEEDQLTQAGITDPTARKYAVWRRAVLWVSVLPLGFATLFGFVNAIGTNTEHLSGFGILVIYLESLVFLLLPAFAVMAALSYEKPGESARWVLYGALVAVGFPILVSFIPTKWRATGSMGEDVRGAVAFGLGLKTYFVLMPMVLSLLPAVSRACIRVKSFLPQSLVPGWGLVASVPLFVLLTLATFVLLYQLNGNLLLMVGLLLWIGAPLYYLTKFRLLTSPLTNKRDIDTLARTQVGVLGMITAGVIFIIIFLFDARIITTDSSAPGLRPWSLELHEVWIDFLGRSLFMTVLFSDLLVRMARAVWREEKAFVGSEHADAFDRTLTSLAESIEQKPGA